MRKRPQRLRSYRLTNGKETGDVDKYLKDWYRIMNPIARELGLVLHCFDPDVVIGNKNYRGSHAQIPLWIAIKLQKMVKELRCLRRNQKKLLSLLSAESAVHRPKF
jgi:hypothetical protein